MTEGAESFSFQNAGNKRNTVAAPENSSASIRGGWGEGEGWERKQGGSGRGGTARPPIHGPRRACTAPGLLLRRWWLAVDVELEGSGHHSPRRGRHRHRGDLGSLWVEGIFEGEAEARNSCRG